MPPHHFDDEDAVMALRSGVEPVDSLRGDSHRSVETEGVVSGRQVVVNGLWNADDR